MADKQTGDTANPPAAPPPPGWVLRSVQNIKRRFQERRAQKKQETAADRAARRTASATVWIALFTLVTIGVGVSQYIVFKRQLKVMADQLTEMKGTGTQTDTLIETNKKLAEAATKSAVIADKTLKITQRAYFSFTPGLTGFEKGGSPTVTLLVRNVGATPAYEATLKTSIAIAKFPLPPGMVLPEVDVPVTATVITREEPLHSTVKMKEPIPDDRFEAIDKGTDSRIITWGVLDFNDAFGCKIRRTVCYFYNGDQIRANAPDVCGDDKNTEKYIGECPQ